MLASSRKKFGTDYMVWFYLSEPLFKKANEVRVFVMIKAQEIAG